MGKSVYILVAVALLLTSVLPGGWQPVDAVIAATTGSDLASEDGSPGVTSRPAPAQSVPYHDPGHLSPAVGYTTWVDRVNENGIQQAVQISGLEAMMADGALEDPLAGNYRLVNMDKVFTSGYQLNNLSLQTYAVSPTIELIPGSQLNMGNLLSHDVAAGDLNGDAVDEQIAAWIAPSAANTGHIILDVGDMQGVVTNTRTTSSPAIVLRADNVLDLVVRGYDDALWHREYNVAGATWGSWDNLAGGLLLSAPAIASRGANQLDVFAIGIDDGILPNYLVVMTNHFNGSAWSGWTVLDNPDENNPPANWPTVERLVPMPNLTAPAVVARGGQLDLFWRWPDNTLRYRHYTGSAWETWQNLGGALSTGPGAVAMDTTHTTVFAGGVDGALWYQSYSGSWGSWMRLPMNSITGVVTIASAPSAVSPQTGKITVYLRGSDNQLWQNTYTGSAWGKWASAGGVLASGAAAAASQASNTTYLYAQEPAGSLQQGITISGDPPSWTPGWSWLEHCCQDQPFDTELIGYFDAGSVQEDYINNISVRTGHLFGDGRQQIVLAYRRNVNEVGLQVYDIKDGFFPKSLLLVDTWRPGQFPKLTLGDFNKDGVDEIGFLYYLTAPAIQDVKIEVELFSLDVTNWQLDSIATAEYPLVNPAELCPPPWTISTGGGERTYNIESGDLDGDGRAEIVLSWDLLANCTLSIFSYMGYLLNYSVLDVTSGGIALAYREYTGHTGGWDDVRCCSADSELAVGDVDGNGVDEIIRTWPYGWDDNDWPDLYRSLQVVDSSVLMTPTLMVNYAVPGWSRSTWRDELAVGDLDRDLVDEIVFFESDSDYDPDLDKLWFYEYSAGSLQSMGDPFLFGNNYFLFIATGDFTGESLRVGPPTYRRQYSVGAITAVINAPPKHIDVLDGETYDINSQDEETRAELTLGESSSTNVSVSTTREFSLALDFVTTIGDPEATHTKDSIGLSYGSHFEKTEGTFADVEFKETRTASNDDALFYMRTDYEVWEYPAYVLNSDVPASHITVVFPIDTPRMRVDRGNTCDSWYRSRHQLANVWSYPETQDSFLDLAEPISSRSEYLVSSDQSDFSYLFETGDVSSYSSQVERGFSNEFEWQIGGEEIEFSLFDVVSFSTRLPSFMMSTKTAYKQSELSTLEITTNNSTQIDGYLNGVPDADLLGYDYAVRPFLYWSTSGAMVLDYTTAPEGTFWDYYADPDPAFILPWENGQCGLDKLAFSRDVLNDPPVASEGQVITTTAVVRNFSYEDNHSAFLVSFYRGDPDAGGTLLGSQTIGAYELGPREVIPVSIQWNASGMGEQRIYAVIDPLNQLEEVHDETDAYVNNNKGYALLDMGDVDFVDIGLAKETEYYATHYALGDTLQVTFSIPPGNLPETARVDLRDTLIGMGNVVGNPFELAAYIGSSPTNPWTNPIPNYPLRQGALDPPAALAISYGNNDLGSFNENNLTLYRKTNTGWVDATCSGYAVSRFNADNLLVVPICEAGIFALSVGGPYWPILLPVVAR
jgi:hypothetical protein